MPVTRNVAWDGRLESFKGRDTTQYVTTAAAIATTCALCRGPLRPDEPLSLSVDITESTAPDGTRLPAGHEPGYTDILDQATEVEDSCSMTVTGAGFLTLNVGGETIYAERLDADDPDDAEWLGAAGSGRTPRDQTYLHPCDSAPLLGNLSLIVFVQAVQKATDHSPITVPSVFVILATPCFKAALAHFLQLLSRNRARLTWDAT